MEDEKAGLEGQTPSRANTVELKKLLNDLIDLRDVYIRVLGQDQFWSKLNDRIEAIRTRLKNIEGTQDE